MRGWRYIGQISEHTPPYGDSQAVRMQAGEPIAADVGDVIAFSWDPSAPFRAGNSQIRSIDQTTRLVWVDSLSPTVSNGDYVFVATALGENAFKRSDARNSE